MTQNKSMIEKGKVDKEILTRPYDVSDNSTQPTPHEREVLTAEEIINKSYKLHDEQIFKEGILFRPTQKYKDFLKQKFIPLSQAESASMNIVQGLLKSKLKEILGEINKKCVLISFDDIPNKDYHLIQFEKVKQIITKSFNENFNLNAK